MSTRFTSTKTLAEFLEATLQTTPRGILSTYPQIYAATGALPTTVRAATLPTLTNPHQLILNTPKHNQPSFNRYLFAHELRPERFGLMTSAYGLSGYNLASAQSNFWLFSVRRTSWYELQQRALRSYLWIRRLPGVRRVYLLGSSAMGAATRNSDVDLIIEARPHWVWVVRLWLKIILKLRTQDVFRTSFQLRRRLGILERQEPAEYKKPSRLQNRRRLDYRGLGAVSRGPGGSKGRAFLLFGERGRTRQPGRTARLHPSVVAIEEFLARAWRVAWCFFAAVVALCLALGASVYPRSPPRRPVRRALGHGVFLSAATGSPRSGFGQSRSLDFLNSRAK